MSFQSIIGQPLAVELCRTWLKRQTTNPLLFYGPEGVGKRTLARATAKALNCQSPSPAGRGAGGEGAPCGICLACKKVTAGTHPDVRLIDFEWQAAERKEPLEKQQNLRLETILAERHRLLQSPVEGAWKVSMIDDAHRLTADAANVLLKILEEPPAQTAIFLITPFRDRLFATLISRCQPVRLRALTDEEVGQCLTHLGIPQDKHARLTELAMGSPGHAMHWSREEQIEAVGEAERLWQALGGLSPARAAHETSGRSKAARPARADVERSVQSLLIPATRALRAGEPASGRPVQILQNALTQLRQNVQPALVYDNLLLELAKVKR